MNAGKAFEADWKNSTPNNCFYKRIADAAQSFGADSSLRFSNKNPYDVEIYKFPYLYALELKSTTCKSLSFERIGEKSSSPMIKGHQLKGLLDASHHTGVIAGLIINFRSSNETFFIHISEFLRFAESTTKKSINQTDILLMAHIKIEQTLKRTRYCYDIAKFLTDAANTCCTDNLCPIPSA